MSDLVSLWLSIIARHRAWVEMRRKVKEYRHG